MTNWLEGLNSQQKEAATQTEGPLLILAGAGSGKTTVLIARTGYILSQNKARPSEILVLTFTNKAARELDERVSAKLKFKKEKIWTGTFHAFGLEFLKKNYKAAGLPRRFALIDTADARFIVKDLLRSHFHSEKSNFDTEILLKEISNRRAGKKPSPKTPEEYVEMAELLTPEYLKRMHSLGVIDFDGLLLKPMELLKKDPELRELYRNKFKYIMVDEFQDTNKMQMDLIQQLIGEQQNIAVVGDDDQSIYGWRGAEIENILGFPRLFKNCKTVRLEINYRSTPEILELANNVIQENEDRHKKKLLPHNPEVKGEKPELYVYENEEGEIEEVVNLIRNKNKNYPYGSIAVLFRSNAQGGVLEGMLRQNRIPYDLTGGPGLVDRKEVRDVLAYMKSALFPNDITLRRIINTPHRGIGDTSIQKIIDLQEEQEVSFIKALRQWKEAGVIEKTGREIDSFFELLAKLKNRLLAQDGILYQDRLPQIFKEIDYKEYVMSSYKDSTTAFKKWQLVEILGRVLDSFFQKSDKGPALTIKDFIDTLSLRDTSTEEDKDQQKVQLLTYHASKGLEFPLVILLGVDEGLIPHETLGHNMSEERRLFYVGVTRAKKELILTRARQRKRYGKMRKTSASRFLLSLPKDLYHEYPNGIRPITEEQRVDLLKDLYQKLDQKIAKEGQS